MRLIEAEKLTLGYEGQSVIDNISFSVDEGDYLCIIGDNGAGKSTLVKAVLSLHEPLAGRLSFHFDRKDIGYLPQSSAIDVNFPTSVSEVVLSGFISHLGRRFFYPASMRKKADENLDRMGILNLRNRSFQELSGGQRQRVLLARALCAANRLLLLDEPAASLDVHSASELYRLIDQLNSDGMTVMMVTHDIHPAINSASHILHLGGENFFGTRDEYFSSEIGRDYLKEAGHHD